MAAVVPIIVPPVARHQKRIVAAFRAAGATDRSRAVTVEKLAVREGTALSILRRHGIVRDAGNQMLWLDEAAWNAREAKGRRFAIRFAVGMAMLVLAALWTLWVVQH